MKDALEHASCKAIWLLHFELPFRWTDPKTWPWFLYLWLALGLVSWLKPLLRWLQREQAKSWPSASARIDSAHVAEPKRFLGLTLQSQRNRGYDAVLAYSYTLSGDSRRGEYHRTCGSVEEANEFLRGLEGQHVSVQYNPRKPARSVLLEDSIDALLRNRPPATGPANAWADAIPGWLKPLLPILAVLALVGFCLSFAAHIGALFGRRVLPDYFFGVLHAGVFLVFGPTVLLVHKRLGGTTHRDFWKLVTKGAPDGLRYLLYALFFYAFVISIPAFINAPPGLAPRTPDPFLQWREFSSGWMIFYCASFTILTAILNTSRQSNMSA